METADTAGEELAFEGRWLLYEASFPRHEQRLPDEQRAVLSHPEYHFTQLFDGAELGLLLYWEAEDFRYVEHFCVRPELRGRRYGAKALEELGRDGKTVVLEIDPPVDEIARRRQGFTSGWLRCQPLSPRPSPTGRSTQAMSWWCSPAPGR